MNTTTTTCDGCDNEVNREDGYFNISVEALDRVMVVGYGGFSNLYAVRNKDICGACFRNSPLLQKLEEKEKDIEEKG